jgi:hypothetical protein
MSSRRGALLGLNAIGTRTTLFTCPQRVSRVRTAAAIPTRSVDEPLDPAGEQAVVARRPAMKALRCQVTIPLSAELRKSELLQ